MVFNNKSQITIFIILALVLVVVIVLIFIGRDRISISVSQETPIEQLSSCINKVVLNSTKIIFPQGGSLKPESYYLYNGYNVQYLCYTNEYYQPCVMQKPLLRQHIENEIKRYSESRIQDCIDTLKISLEKKGYDFSFKRYNLTIELLPEYILINLKDINLKISKDTTESYKSFKTSFSSDSYNMVMIAYSILNWEARYGDSEAVGYMIYYPKIIVEKKKQSDGTKVYNITNEDSKENFMFSTRSYVMPPGILGL